MNAWMDWAVCIDSRVQPLEQSQEGSQSSGSWWSYSGLGDVLSQVWWGRKEMWNPLPHRSDPWVYRLHVQENLNKYRASWQNFYFILNFTRDDFKKHPATYSHIKEHKKSHFTSKLARIMNCMVFLQIVHIHFVKTLLFCCNFHLLDSDSWIPLIIPNQPRDMSLGAPVMVWPLQIWRMDRSRGEDFSGELFCLLLIDDLTQRI